MLCPAASQAHPGESPRCASAPPLTRSPPLTLPRVARIRQGVPCLRRRSPPSLPLTALVAACSHSPALARCRPPPPTCPAALARRVSGEGGALFSWASAVSRPAGTLSRPGWRCQVRFRVLAGVAGCAFACWRALFQIVLGLMCPGGPSRWGKSQNDDFLPRSGIGRPPRRVWRV